MTDAVGLDSQVAVYIDFDNIVISRYDELHDRGSFRNDKANSRGPSPIVRQRLATARLNVDAIMDYASSFGTVALSRAYANWSDVVNASYAVATMERSIDLVQLFPMTGTKNGADIRLAIDVIDDLSRYPDITHVVVVAGDSDYVALAQRCKRFGRRVIGVGAANSVGKYWEAACDEFRYYGALPGVTEVTAIATVVEALGSQYGLDADAIGTVLFKAIELGLSKTGGDKVAASWLKPQMKRLAPSFDERVLGYANFTGFLNSYSKFIEVETGDSGSYVRLREASAGTVDDQSDGGDDEIPALTTALADLRHYLALAATASLGENGELTCIRAIRTVWEITDPSLPSRERIPGSDLVSQLVADGISTADAKLAERQILSTGIPIVVRDESMRLMPNPELTTLTDDELLTFFREWTADRARNHSYPEPITAEAIGEAMHGKTIPPSALVAYDAAIKRAGYAQMCEAIGPRLLAGAVLWDVAASVGVIPSNQPLNSVEVLAGAIAGPLAELERDVNSVTVSAAYLSLQEAGLISSAEKGYRNTAAGWRAKDVAAAVLRAWAKTLTGAELLDKESLISLESFYRIALQDRYRVDWRAWTKDLV